MTYLLLQVSRMIQALTARADPFKAACRASSSHQNKTDSGKAQVEHRRAEPCSQQRCDLSLLGCSASSYQSVNHERTCAGLTYHSLSKGLHTAGWAKCDVAGQKQGFCTCTEVKRHLEVALRVKNNSIMCGMFQGCCPALSP